MSGRTKVFAQTMLAAVLFLLTASVSFAAAEGGAPNQDALRGDFKWIHFVILAALLLWVFGKLLPPWFRGNADAISASIGKAKAAKAEAAQKLKEATAKLANLEREIAEFRAIAEREAAAELERLKTLTRSDAEKIGAAARAEIDAAERAARAELKALAARMAVDRAEQQVAGQMTPAIQDAMINNFVQSLEGRPN